MIINTIGDMIESVTPFNKDGVVNLIVHGCNCQGRMNSGIAKTIRDMYPKVFHSYLNLKNTEGLKLGDAQFVKISEDFIIINAMTQEYYGGFEHPDGVFEPYNKLFCSYDAVSSAFTIINEYANSQLANANVIVNFPLIGCGLANGDWQIVSTIIDTHLSDNFAKVLWKLPETTNKPN